MKCSLCGMEFREEDAKKGCRGCIMAGGCGKLRCPNCGYENLMEPGSLKAVKGMVKRWKR